MRLSRVIIICLTLCVLCFGTIFGVRWYHPYPFNHILTQADGRSIQVSVIGKTGDKVHFVKSPEEQRFEYPIAQLSSKDRLFLMLLEDQRPPPPAPAPQPVVEETRYVENRLAAIRENEKKIGVMDTEINSGTLNNILQTRRERERDDLRRENAQMKADIETYKYRMKIK